MVSSAINNKDKILTIHINRIHVSPEHIRHTVPDITPLKDTIADVGLLQPILVRQTQCGYTVIDGARRLKALKELEVQELIIGRDVIVESSETEADEKFRQIIANVQREDINDIELGHAFVTLKEQFGYEYKDVAEIIGKTPHYVAAKVGLAKRLSPEVQAYAISDRNTVKCTQNTFSGDNKSCPYIMNANVLEDVARLPQGLQMRAYETIKSGNMGQDEALHYINKLKNTKINTKVANDDDRAIGYGSSYGPYNRCLKNINREIDKLSISIRSGGDRDRYLLAPALKSLIERLNMLYIDVKDRKGLPEISVYTV
jgi:ParB family chromosome partitioning protein